MDRLHYSLCFLLHVEMSPEHFQVRCLNVTQLDFFSFNGMYCGSEKLNELQITIWYIVAIASNSHGTNHTSIRSWEDATQLRNDLNHLARQLVTHND